MPNPQNLAPLFSSQNLRSARGICGTAALADKANKHRKQAKRFVEEVGEVTTRKRVAGAQNNKRKKKVQTQRSQETKAMQVYDNFSDSGKIEVGG